MKPTKKPSLLYLWLCIPALFVLAGIPLPVSGSDNAEEQKQSDDRKPAQVSVAKESEESAQLKEEDSKSYEVNRWHLREK